MRMNRIKHFFLIVVMILTSLQIPSLNVEAATSTNWSWPTSVHTIKSDWPTYSGGGYHGGTDFPVALNSPVYSTCDGEVVAVTSLTTSYGKHIKIKAVVNGSTVYMRYCHLNSFAVSVGDKVKSGQLIAYSGSTGNSTGPHLHYEVRNANDYYGNASSPNLNPRNYLPGSSYAFNTHDINPPTIKEPVNLGDSFSARIRSCSGEKLLTDVGGKVVLTSHGNNKIASQIWKFNRNSDGSYFINSSINNTCFDLENYADADGTNILMWENKGTDNQRWFIYKHSDGTYYLQSACSSSRVLDIDGGSDSEGAKVQLWSNNGGENQKFSIEKCGEILNIGEEFSGFIFNDDAWKPILQTDEEDVVLGTENSENMPRILWHCFRNSDTGYYTIYSYLNGKCLDVDGGVDADGANVKCYDFHDGDSQKWYILRREDGSTYLKSACSSRNLALLNNNASDGEKIQLWSNTNSPAQEFTIYQINGDRDVISYKLYSSSTNMTIGEKTYITIANALYAINYKLHIVSPSGITETIELGSKYTYQFSPSEVGTYKIYASVKSPVSEYSGSEEESVMTIKVNSPKEEVCVHKYSPEVTKEASCTETGIRTYTCSACQDFYTETINKTSHQYSNQWTVDVEATYTSEGSKSRHCLNCDAKTDVITIPRLEQEVKGGTFSLTNASGTVGQTVDIYINIAENPGIVGATLAVEYDTNKLQLISCEDLGVLNDYQFSSIDRNPFMLNWEDPLADENNMANGNIAKLQFKILEDLGQDGAELRLAVDTVYDVNVEDVEFATMNGKITMKSYTSGDVNEDGTINSKDSLLVRKYILGENVTINLSAADVNRDGIVNSKDSMILRKYILGDDVELK